MCRRGRAENGESGALKGVDCVAEKLVGVFLPAAPHAFGYLWNEMVRQLSGRNEKWMEERGRNDSGISTD